VITLVSSVQRPAIDSIHHLTVVITICSAKILMPSDPRRDRPELSLRSVAAGSTTACTWISLGPQLFVQCVRRGKVD